MKIDTQLVQTGVGSDPRTGAISVPVYQTATFRHPALGESTGYDYSRFGNPTRTALETGMACIEKGAAAAAFASGLAAITSLLLLFPSGTHLVVSDDLYGGTYRLLEKTFKHLGISATYVDTSDPGEVEAAITDKTKALFIETPTNPMMKITDLRVISTLARRYGLLTIVDNTFLTPYLQRPLELGADLVVYSATKYLAGHNDVVAGIVVAATRELAERVFFIQNAAGAVLGPQDSWLVIRGLKTLGVRMDRHQYNARRLARWLARHPGVDKVYYPGLPDHPGHGVCRSQSSGFGGMISFTLRETQKVEQVLKRVKIISFAESLGGVETLITFPARQTHADIPEEMRQRIGITDNLLRLSVGLEDVEDLQADLEQALG
ncbi:MAG: trans-sulfuration enzyme family protein [Bacillota bacterium]